MVGSSFASRSLPAALRLHHRALANLFGASVWFLDKHATQAARDGWSPGDIFGIEFRMERWGGLIDRLGECRGLLMDADRASWPSSFYGARTYRRGCGTGLQPLWNVEL